MFDGHPHPAASLTAEERAKAIVYLEWLDDHWRKHGEDGWFKSGRFVPGRVTGYAHCLVTPAISGAGPDLASAWLAVDAMGIKRSQAVDFNNDPSTTFTMVHTRVKDTLAACRALEGAS